MSDSFEHEVEVNGVRLHVRLDGRRDAPVVALVNSLATDHTMWDPQIPALTADYRVLRYDARGHGRSAAPDGRYTMDMLVDDLLGLLRAHDIRRAHVVGVSLGGLTAMATGLRAPPELVSIVPCDCRADMPPEFARGIEDRNRLVREQGMQAIADTMVQRWFTAPTLAAAPAYLERVRAMIRQTSVAGFTGCAEAIKTSGLRERAARIRTPALFVVGSDDAALPVALMTDMQRELAGSELAVIAGAGHLANVEQPDRFNAALLAFLRRQG
jgi:3-oxoadipate enol-lactonase